MDPSAWPDGRITALGNQLVDIHIRLREELERLRDGHRARPRDLRTHCLAFCSALRRHHGAEDGGAFPALAARFPALRPVLDELERDHRLVADSLRRVEELPEAGFEAELDTLAALLETHFTYEERRLVAALNALDARAGTVEELLGRVDG
jgi:hypothetical protein